VTTDDQKPQALTGKRPRPRAGSEPAASRGADGAGDFDRSQVTAIKLGRRLGERIAAEHPRVADEYRAGQSYAEIAATIPGLVEAARSPRIAAGAVGFAVRELIGIDELRRLMTQHRRATLARTSGGFGTEEGRDFSSRAGRRNVELHGIDTDRMTRAKGCEPWSATERATALQLLADPAYRHARGSGRGWPDYARIAEALNREYHGGRAVRSVPSVKCMLQRAADRSPE
jgi:hypothetical protein